MKEYWAKKSGDELSIELYERVKSFQDFVLTSGLSGSWRKNRDFYENRIVDDEIGSDILDAGEVGELKATTFNHFRNILRHMINQITAQVPSYDVSATNVDVKSRRSTSIGRDLVKYYFKARRLSKHMASAVEKANVYGDGFLVCEFNPTIGRVITVDENGRFMREGDFDFEVLSPDHVFYDPMKQSREKWDWVTFRKPRNKFDLAAVFPKKKTEIIETEGDISDDSYDNMFRYKNYSLSSDDIYVYSTYHKATNVLPRGRYILWIGCESSQTILYDSDNPYREELPIFGLSPSFYLETAFGFTEANILRSAQMALTMAVSAMVTNLSMGAENNIWTPRGSGLTVEKLLNGANHIQSDVRPEVVSFYQENPNLVNMLQLCTNTMETLSGQNAVIRGNVKDTPNLKSGIALATVINQAQEYSQALQKGYYDLFEDVMSFILTTLKSVANEERIYEISGKQNRSAVKSFTSKDLEGVSRVTVERTNPVANTPAGRIEIAMELLKMGVIKPEQFFDVMNTGNLDVATKSDEMLLDYVASVKERLLDGQKVIPVPGINHQLFVQEIQSLLFDIDLTSNPENAEIVRNITETIQGHMNFVRNGDEVANLIYGGQPPTPRQIGNDELNIEQQQQAPVDQGPQATPVPSAPMF
jgi:hypothetical protein